MFICDATCQDGYDEMEGCCHRARFDNCTSDQESPVFASDCLSVNYTEGESGVNHSLASCKLSLLLYLTVSNAPYTFFRQPESMSLHSLSR